MGPTASGKTALAFELVQQLPCEIISVDSALVYRGMDIGTAKPDARLLQQAPHRLIDICDPSETYSAARFRQDALLAMEEIQRAGKIPLLVGGTFLYFRALEQGLSPLPQANAQVRQKIEQWAQQQGWEQVHRRLRQVDPEAAQRIHPNDPQRIQRALEVYEITGMSMSELMAKGRDDAPPYNISKIVVAPQDRTVLHERIAARLNIMMQQGFIEEVQGLWERGDLNAELPSMRAVGYRQVWQYLQGELERVQLEEKILFATRQYAKRQLTWLRSEANAQWFDPTEQEILPNVLKKLRFDTIF
ncbi:MAG: tRNA (adenosine(37)-N6)-dimethylallyltransferase MiaA [Gammaproteobacteria bacterium]|nr:tRNA (adenosine(37)-N6)-dimethylallyltransferase MiaA [Gammaproteobacteria bacterium]MDH5800726.1 tRNA (adenosine(37)-N6)-dimethylallyltransferase MiaA [Gammaproteobacteria bacterium]